MKPMILSIALFAAVVGGSLFAQNAEARGPRWGYGGVSVQVGGNRAYRPYYGGYYRPYNYGYYRNGGGYYRRGVSVQVGGF